jgi:4-diphosphocytidyl-2-C-methyl-D-erythritol kinase
VSREKFRHGRRPVGKTITLRAPAKVNLHLEVIKRRHDGYHELETVLQAIEIFDRLAVTLEEEYRGGEPDITLRLRPTGSAPQDQSNLAWMAARLFCRRQRVSGRLFIDLVKEIPSEAGLGGGSSDAAAVLVACDRLFATQLEIKELEELAAELGSDVPFFIAGGTVLAHGRGTRLTPLPKVRKGRFLVLKPDFELATSKIYDGLRMGLTVRSPKANIQRMKPLIARFPTSSWFGFNRLEEVVLPSHPALQRTILRLRELAPVAMLSGSGSAAFAVFEDDRELPAVVEEIAQTYQFHRVVGPHAVGVEITDE